MSEFVPALGIITATFITLAKHMTSFLSRFPRLRNHVLLLLGLIIAIPVLFFPILRFSFPLGYAGMFAQMAEQIAQANFALPMTIPHYGPGGIPFVYPPFALYVFAIALKIGVPTWIYLRLAPAFFMLLALIPLYFLTLEITESKVAAMVSMILLATAPSAYYTHVWSAGVVRALALGLCLTGLFFYVRALRDFSWLHFFLAGLFLGLLLITHWLYIVFAALFGLAYLLANWRLAHLRTSFGILLIACLVATPWLALSIARHGIASLLIASNSHGNTAFLQSFSGILQLIGGNLQYVTDNWFLAALVIPGLLLLLARKKFALPLAFIFVLFMGEAFFYTILLAAMLAGALSGAAYELIPDLAKAEQPLRSRLFRALPVFLALVAILFSAISGIREISSYEPEIDTYSFQMAKFVRGATDKGASYLYVGKINEAEWFPYLLDRTPVFALWGSEWKGDYDQQSETLIALRDCQLKKSWSCMADLQSQQKVTPDLLIVPNQRWLFVQIKDTHAWQTIYSDDRYLVWGKLK